MAFLMTQAGGLASNGTIPILDIEPKTIHQRSTIYLGSKKDVETALEYIKNYDNWNKYNYFTIYLKNKQTFKLFSKNI